MLVALWTPRHRVRPSARPTGSKRLREARQGFFVPGCPLLSSAPAGLASTLAFNPVLTLKLSIQVALLGEVTDRLVAVTCGIKDQVVSVRAYVRGAVQEDDVETLSFIAGEVIADFPDGYMIEETCVSADDGEPQMLDFWAFKRKD